MRIASLTLKKFKRFTEFAIDEVPETAKLVLLIGANGSGKSSVFDAFNLLSAEGPERVSEIVEYHRKQSAEAVQVSARFHGGGAVQRSGKNFSATLPGLRLLGRSSLRVAPQIERVSDAGQQIATNQDRPQFFTHEDRRFFADVTQFTAQIDRALREPTFAGQQADTLAIFRRYIEPFNEALRRIFGDSLATTIQIKNFDNSNPQRAIQLFFTKGGSVVPFDILSHGEKQIVILLMNFAVRREQYVRRSSSSTRWTCT